MDLSLRVWLPPNANVCVNSTVPFVEYEVLPDGVTVVRVTVFVTTQVVTKGFE